ncbi:MAG: hypothetical protein WC564_05040 [Patescibacteria group bacterium]|jgi:hypothetical protein
MKILIFLHGTIIMHKNAASKTREDRVRQSSEREKSVLDYESYIPIGNAVEKLRGWNQQGAEIIYLSSHRLESDVVKDKLVLKKFNFPEGLVLFRKNGEKYNDLVETNAPDVLVEDDCESIGGEKEMTITFVRPEIRQKIKLIVVREFQGVDGLSDNINFLLISK